MAKDTRAGVDAIVADSSEKMQELTQRLRDKEISLAEWQAAMSEEIKDGNTLAVIAAKGGEKKMTGADWALLGAVLLAQYGFLKRFAQQIFSGAQKLNSTAINRASAYADAIRTSYERFTRKDADIEQEAQEERRILGIADHCRTRGDLLGCVELARKGWQPIGTLPSIGNAPCITHCKCHFIWRKKVNGKWVVFQ